MVTNMACIAFILGTWSALYERLMLTPTSMQPSLMNPDVTLNAVSLGIKFIQPQLLSSGSELKLASASTRKQ